MRSSSSAPSSRSSSPGGAAPSACSRYAASALVGSTIFWVEGSPWIGGKAIAIASPLALSLALVAAGWVYEHGRRVEAVLAAAAIVFGVAWSDAWAYHDAFLAPSSRLSELEAIGNRFAGQGPALETDYDPYGARHFLRKLDAEATSELRVRPILLRTGAELQIGASADLDEIALPDVLVYRTIVLRASPAASRPPSVYQPIAATPHYQVWQRPVSGAPTILEHLSLGDRLHAAAVPKCTDVLRLAKEAGPGGRLAAVVRPPNTAVDLSGAAPGARGPVRRDGRARVSARLGDVPGLVPSARPTGFTRSGSTAPGGACSSSPSTATRSRRSARSRTGRPGTSRS